MGKGYLSYTMALILLALENGYRYGFDVMVVTGLASGTVYPALRRLEEKFDKFEADQLRERIRNLEERVSALEKNTVN